MLKKLSIKIFLAFFLFASAAQSNTTIFQDFENPSSFSDNFTKSTNSSGSFAHSATGGIGNSGKVNIPSSSDVIYTTKQKYSIEDNGVYTLSALFHSQYNSGYGSFGFTTAATSNASGSQGSPAEASFGVSFHAGGGSWMNNNTLTSLTWANGGLDVNTTNAEWYLFKLIITDKTGGSFDLDFTIYNVNQTTGEIISTLTNHTTTITNTEVKSANDLYVFFGAEGQRMIGFDNFTIDLSDNVTVSGTQTGQTQSGGDETTDPTTKADVMGTVESMSNASINFARTSVRSIRNRLDWLERNNSDNTSNQGIKVTFKKPVLNTIFSNKDDNSFDTKQLVSQIPVKDNFSKAVYNPLTDHLLTELSKKVNDYVKDKPKVQLANLNPTGKALIHDWSIWTEGQIFIGKIDATSVSSSQNSDSLNLAIGMDRPMKNREGLIGFALNVGQDEIKIGSAGSDVNSDNISLSYYNVIPTDKLFDFETQVGIGYMSVDSLRIDGDQRLNGNRDIWMPFGSVTVRNKTYEFENGTFTPYGRGEVAFIQLDQYAESGGNLALSYNKQTIDRYMLFLGSDINFNKTFKDGKLKPFAAIEYGLDLTSNSDVKMNYVGSSTVYQTELEKLASSNVMMKLGFDYEGKDQTQLSFSYERNEAIGAGHSNSIQIKFSKPLGKVN